MTFNPILFYEYGKGREVINLDIYDIQTVLNTSVFSATPMVMWFKPYLASDFPELTCDKRYIFIYSTDHASDNIGGIYWGKGDNLNCSDFIEQGLIINGYQAESPQLVRIPSAECGDSNVIHLYYHTNATDPTNSSKQLSHLITTTGGLLHTATWTQRGLILGGLEPHTGYLKVSKQGISNYKGIHLILGGAPQKYGISVSSTGRTYVRNAEFRRSAYLPADKQYKGVVGTFIFDLYGNNWWIGNVVPIDFIGDTTFCLIKVDANLQPKQFCANLNNNIGVPIVMEKSYGDLEVYLENNIAYLYWGDGLGSVKLAKYNLSNLLTYQQNATFPIDAVSIYDFENNLIDLVGDNDGSSTSIKYANDIDRGVVGWFDTIGGFPAQVTVNNAISLQLQDIGLRLYFKTSNAGTGMKGLIVKQLAWGIFVDGGILKLYSWGAPTGYKVTTVNLNDNLWHKIDVKFRNGIVNGTEIYVDDVLKLTTTYAFSAQTQNILIGNGDQPNQNINGYLDDVQVYNLPTSIPDPNVIPPINSISYYTVNNDVFDYVGNNEGTPTMLEYVNDAEMGVVGYFNGINGTGTKINTTNATEFQANNIGVELYFKTSNAGTGLRGLVVKQLAWGIFVDGGILKLYSWGAPTGYKVTTVNLNDNLWHKIDVKFRNGIVNGTEIYVDDVLKLTTTYGFSTQTKKIVIGNGSDNVSAASNQEINGYIKDVRVYNLP